MESSQENSPKNIVHDEIILDNSDSGDEASNVKYENAKNNSKTNNFSPLYNKSHGTQHINKPPKSSPPQQPGKSFNSSPLNKSYNIATSTPKSIVISDWDILMYKNVDPSVQIEQLVINDEHLDNPYQHNYYCLSKSLAAQETAYKQMIQTYNAWRKKYNDLHGYRTAMDISDVQAEDVSQVEEKPVEDERIEQNQPELAINDEQDFPELGSRAKTSTCKAHTSSGRTVSKCVEVQVEDNDPDDEDFIPSAQSKSGKKSKRVLYKPVQDSNIFDFDDNVTLWKASKEETKKHETKHPRAQPPQPLQPPEEKIPCPICNKLFPMSEIQDHASDCLSYQDDSHPR